MQANIRQGATALDVGCGGGVVTFRLSHAVGAQGQVVGLDLNAKALAQAREQAKALGVTNTRFLEADLFVFAKEGLKFDVITCRRVLMYLPDQARAVKVLHDLLQPDGVLIIQEHDATIRHATSKRPLAEQAQAWIWDTVTAEGGDTGTGFQLYQRLSDAGFTDITLSAEAVIETPTQIAPTVDIIRAMLSRIEAAGVATAAQIDIETLEARLNAERATAQATSIGEMMFGAIAR